MTIHKQLFCWNKWSLTVNQRAHFKCKCLLPFSIFQADRSTMRLKFFLKTDILCKWTNRKRIENKFYLIHPLWLYGNRSIAVWCWHFSTYQWDGGPFLLYFFGVTLHSFWLVYLFFSLMSGHIEISFVTEEWEFRLGKKRQEERVGRLIYIIAFRWKLLFIRFRELWKVVQNRVI